MPRPLDIGWQYGTMIGNHRHHVKCNYCHRIMIGGITRFKKHLASKKGEIKGCEAVPKEVREIIRKHLASLKPRRPNKRRRKSSDANFVEPPSNYEMELVALDPDMRQKMLAFSEAETQSEQQFEVGTSEFVDAYAIVQCKDEQEFASSKAADLGWAHGVMVNGDRQKIECRYCHKVILGGGISRLKQHLAGERGNIAPCEQVPDDVKAQVRQHLGFKVLERLKKQKDTEVTEYSFQQGLDEYAGDIGNVTSPRDGSHNRRGMDFDEGNSIRRKKIETSYIAHASAIPQSSLHFSIASQENIDQADIAVAKFMYEIGVPLNAANSIYFQKMADAIAAVGPGYKMPSCHALRGQLLNRCTNEVREHSQELRKSWEVTGCTVMVDRWMDKAGRIMINFFVYCPKGIMFLKSIDASEIERTLEDLVGLFDSVVQDVGSGNIVHFLMDGSSWSKAAGQVLMNKYRTFFWSVCAKHCIELIFKGFSDLDDVNGVIAKARKISQLVYNYAWVLDLLKKITEGRDIVLPSMAPFITDFLSLQSLFFLKESLHQIFTSNSWEQSELSKQKLGIEVKEIVLDSQFWHSCSRIINIVNPLITVLNLADSAERPSMGYIYDAIEKAKKEIIIAFDNNESDYLPYLDIINHVQDEFHSPLHAAAYYLNPATYYNPNFSISNVIQKGLLDCIETLEPDASAQDNITRHKGFYEDAIGDFGRPMALRGRQTLSPATWWSMYGSDYPNLQRFAIRILSQTCSMVQLFDRACNINEFIHSSKNRLEQARLADLNFIHYNLRHQQRQPMGAGSILMQGEHDPISVDNPNVAEWIKDPGLIEGEGSISLLDVTLLGDSVPAVDRDCNLGDDNFGNVDVGINGNNKGDYNMDSLN
ncbi:hypothetical protein Cni_G05804 [Canna indica]|uniref:BED-type domain-containing protein n=1 Tax=Canna indica TaxID=4628 RepID=A0AAQ3JVV3_9LILI|nr:hypothetical protein Cni_G05804 [Canna indica]